MLGGLEFSSPKNTFFQAPQFSIHKNQHIRIISREGHASACFLTKPQACP
jgi:hypothetical protein